MPASLLLLVAAWERPTVRGLRRAPAVLALVVALTVAQPFGVVASKQEGDAPRPPPRPEPSPLSPAQSNGDDVHVARLFGLVPVLPFRFYQREKPLSGLAENTPNKTLRIRSWFWLPILTNATRVADTCSEDVLTPCWEPGYPYGKELTVYRRGGSQWATLYNPPGEGSGPAQIPDSFTWKLSAGVASPAGLAYWALAAALVIAARRRRPRATGSSPSDTLTTQPPAASS